MVVFEGKSAIVTGASRGDWQSHCPASCVRGLRGFSRS